MRSSEEESRGKSEGGGRGSEVKANEKGKEKME